MSDMNMLASLKTLFFSTTSRGATAASPAAVGEGSDFAAMLSGSMVEGTPAEAVAAPFAQALPQAEEQAASAIAPDLPLTFDEAPTQPPHDHAPPGLAIAVAAGRGEPDTMPPGLALGLVKHAADPQVEAEALIEAPSSQPQVTDEAGQAVPSTKASPRHKVEAAPEAPVEIDVDAAPVEAKPTPKKAKAGEAEPKDSAPAAAPVPQPVTQPIVAPTATVDAAPVPTVKGEVPAMPPAPVAPTIAAPAIAKEPAPVSMVEGAVRAMPSAPVVRAPAAPEVAMEPAPGPMTKGTTSAPAAEPSAPATNAAPVAQATVPFVQPSPTTQASPAPVAEPTPTTLGHTATPVAERDAKPQEASLPQTPQPIAEQAAATIQTMAPAAPILNGKAVKAEALALLQMVREQVAARQSGASSTRVGEQVSAAARVKDSQPALVADTAPSPSLALLPADMTPLAPAAAPVANPVAVPAAPAVDLSASLGAQVVDMGVSGQWIDGLARDIAGLSANGAQGRFQVNSGQLGTVQVDIRQGVEGAAVSLTVASEAAELALRQDSDRLKLDSALSAVRIAEVRIERAPVGETARSDMGSDTSQRQSSQQQQSGSQTNSAWQNNGQNMGQSQGQGRWQSRENSGFAPKSSGDPAVLNHAEARQDAGIAGRARYA